MSLAVVLSMHMCQETDSSCSCAVTAVTLLTSGEDKDLQPSQSASILTNAAVQQYEGPRGFL